MIADISQLVRRQIADEIRVVFEGRAKGAAPAKAAASAKAAPAARGGRRKSRAQGVAIQDKLHSVLTSAKKGISLGDLVHKSGANRIAVKYHLRALRSQKKAKLTGTRKTALWFAV